MKPLLIYQIFVRNYSKEGTFTKVKEDLDRIKSIGTDIIYLLPIHPIGELKRKGIYGSPYAIKDYFDITKDYGTFDDFKELVDEIHNKNMKIILDMVFHHTSPDNDLLNKHPEYYFYRDGKVGNHVGEWSDIIDLDTSRNDTQGYLLSVLKFWLDKGVDGFRFDVASMIPISFFIKARKELGNEVIFLGESIDWDFAAYLETTNYHSTKDEDMYPSFDYLYNYNYYRDLDRQIKERGHAKKIVDAINFDLKHNPILTRVHCLENHDSIRFMNKVKDIDKQKEWIDFIYNLYGHMFIYMGQEYGNNKDVPLFEKDPLDLNIVNKEIYNFYKIKINENKNKKEIINQELIALDDNTIRVVTKFIDNTIVENIYNF